MIPELRGMAPYTAIAKWVYYPLLDAHKREHMRQYLREAEQNQYRSLEALREIELAGLKRIVAHADAWCPYYRDAFRANGVSAASLVTRDDLRRFPLLTKNDVFANGPQMVSARYHGKLSASTTSGSTGVAMRFHSDSRQLAWTEACQWRGRRWWGVERGDHQLVLWSRPVDPSRLVQLKVWAKYRLRNCVQFDTFQEFDDAKTALVVDAIRRTRPRLVYGYGSSIGRVAEWMARNGQTLDAGERPLLVEYTADHLYDSERQTANEVLGPVVSAYGASECGGVAQQCREGNLHVSVDHAVVEFLRADGTAADPDELGEIVLTTLHNEGMPMIRYRVGDLGSYSTRACACGVNLPLMTLQAGKAVDLIDTSTRQKVSAHVLDYINIHLMKNEVRGIKQFFVEQTAPDHFILSVVQERPFDPRSVELFIERMRSYLGEQIDVTWRQVDDIPLQGSGKRRYFKKVFG